MSPHELKCVAVSIKLQEAAAAMRQIYGSQWVRKQEEAMPVIRAIMRRDNCGVLAAAQRAARSAMDEGMAMFAGILLGTAVECIEGGKEPIPA